MDEKCRSVADLARVRNPWRGKNRRQAAIDAPADHLMDRILGRTRRFGGDPGMDAEDATPVKRARGVNLDDGFGRGFWAGRDAGAGAIGRAKVAALGGFTG